MKLGALTAVIAVYLLFPAAAIGDDGDASVDGVGSVYDIEVQEHTSNEASESGTVTPTSAAAALTVTYVTTTEPCSDGLVYAVEKITTNDSGLVIDRAMICPTGGQDALAFTGPTPTSQVTDAVVAQAFARVPVPASELVIQPPDGRTLVNFETNFYTTNTEPFVRTVRLLGQRVQLRIEPVGYRWVFGDGASMRTEEAGAAYPHLQVTHSYTERGGVRPRVDTTYAAVWRLGAGSWRPVPGTVAAVGDSEALDVRTARPKLVY